MQPPETDRMSAGNANLEIESEKWDRGIHYVATGEHYLKEAFSSAMSAKKVMPGIPVAIFTDLIDHPLTKAFDYVGTVSIVNRSFHDVVEPLLRTPFKKTLHLDTDTYVCGDCTDVFDALDYFDFAGVHDPWRSDLKVETLPHCLPTINGGVLAYRLSDATKELLESWPRIHQEKYAKHTKQNQPSLREAFYLGKARVLVLPPEYNLRTWHPVAVGGFSKVKIIHDRRDDLEALVKKLNKGYRPRIFGGISLGLWWFYIKSKTLKFIKRKISRIS